MNQENFGQRDDHRQVFFVFDRDEGACCAEFHAQRSEAVACGMRRWPFAWKKVEVPPRQHDAMQTSVHQILVPNTTVWEGTG